MNFFDIPMLKSSISFRNNLLSYCRLSGDGKYLYAKRVNYSWKFDKRFHDEQARFFVHDPELYLSKSMMSGVEYYDIFKNKMDRSSVINVFAKFFAHFLFRFFNVIMKLINRVMFKVKDGFYGCRKCYVDDNEKVFDERTGIVFLVFPFPLSFKRQIKYFLFLRKSKRIYYPYGNPYLFVDLCRFLWLRDVHSYEKLESRAAIRLAYELKKMGIKYVEMSDEYDVTSLVFSRTLKRLKISTVNSAHGIGNFLPFHAYESFYVLNDVQKKYYISLTKTKYSIRLMNGIYSHNFCNGIIYPSRNNFPVAFVFLSQVSNAAPSLVALEEEKFLSEIVSKYTHVEKYFYYKPHPNSDMIVPDGFIDFSNSSQKNNFIYISFYSSSYLDPDFYGVKILIETKYLKPSIVFGDDACIMTADDFLTKLEVGYDFINLV